MPNPIVSHVVLHDASRIPVPGDIIKQHKLLSHSAPGNSLLEEMGDYSFTTRPWCL